MDIQEKKIDVNGIKFFIKDDDKEIAHVYLYILKNDLHEKPFGFMEDVYVEEEYRGKGLGSKIVKSIIDKAKQLGCYKLICASRYEKCIVHDLYKKLGFKDHGKEFRIDFS
tara:strand:+ start:1132 stop:1464 length:333 start_codon:yes stop_codon:yes gene_type:complete